MVIGRRCDGYFSLPPLLFPPIPPLSSHLDTAKHSGGRAEGNSGDGNCHGGNDNRLSCIVATTLAHLTRHLICSSFLSPLFLLGNNLSCCVVLKHKSILLFFLFKDCHPACLRPGLGYKAQTLCRFMLSIERRVWINGGAANRLARVGPEAARGRDIPSQYSHFDRLMQIRPRHFSRPCLLWARHPTSCEPPWRLLEGRGFSLRQKMERQLKEWKNL